MIKAGRELGLRFVHFVEEFGRIPERTRLYLRNTHLSIPDLGTSRTPYKLRPAERRNPSDLQRSLSERFTNYNGSGPNTERFTVVTLRDGIPLYFQSYKEVFRKTGISNEAYNYIFDNSLLKFGLGDDEQSIIRFPRTRTGFEENTISTELPRVVSVPTGMGSYPTGSLRQYLSRNPRSNNTFQLALNSVIDVPTSKIFLVYEYPWWLEERFNFTFIQSDLPYRQSFHWGISRNDKAVLLVSYTDLDDVAFWSHLQRRGRVISKRNDDTRVTDEVLRHVHSQISNVYKIDYGCIPVPVDGMMFVWDKYPFNGGWVSWKPGSKSYIKNYLTKPFPQDNIFIVHGYWGGIHNGWGESSLEAADDILTHFGVPSYLSNTLYNKQE
ncbi:achacin-like [Saccostrea echinata]|uniref:achacin-like n=1 Tax=Saccostrea echinata TaxID=191078 RepID=UPI002A8084CA|nr:achacin-like [Saccostrea echinata]